MKLKSLNKRVKVLIRGEWVLGDLQERADVPSLLPQYFAKLDDGTVRDLRNDCYAVVTDE